MSGGTAAHPKQSFSLKAQRELAEAGCSQETAELIADFLDKNSALENEKAEKLEKLLNFAKHLKPHVAYQYFRAIGNTKAVAELTDERVLDFAKSIGSDAAFQYFYVIANTKAVAELTDERVLDFAKSIGSNTTSKYFYAIADTKAAVELTDEQVLKASEFIKSIGSEAANYYFKAIADTKAVAELTDERVLDFAKSIGSDAAYYYFKAIADTKAVVELTDELVLRSSEFINSIGSVTAFQYFNAIADTKAVAELTDEQVLSFAKSIRSAAYQYFRAISETKLVQELTDRTFLAYASDSRVAPHLHGILDHLGVAPETYMSVLRLYTSMYNREQDRAALLKVADRLPDLTAIHAKLGSSGVDGLIVDMAVKHLINKGDKAFITAFSLRVSKAEIPESLPLFLEDIQEAGIDMATVIRAIDAYAVIANSTAEVPEELKGSYVERVRGVLERPGKTEPDEKTLMQLRSRYQDVMEYLDRHLAYAEANRDYNSPIKRDEVLSVLAACLRVRDSLNLNAVNTEKQQLKMNRTPQIKEKYENAFMKELRRALEGGRFETLLRLKREAIMIIPSYICGRAISEREFSQEMLNIFEGFFRITKNNRAVLHEYLRIWIIEGAAAANAWLGGLERNKALVNEMKERGTDIAALEAFSVTYTGMGAKEASEKIAMRVNQLYGELRSMVHQLGFPVVKALLGESGSAIEVAEKVVKTLNDLVNKDGATPEQRVVIDDINQHLKDMRGASGQIRMCSETSHEGITFFIETDPVKKLQIGVGFPSCLDITKGSNSFGAVARAFDANNITMYVAQGDRDSNVVGRISLLDTDKGFLLNSHFYENTNLNLFDSKGGWITALIELVRVTKRDIMIVPSLFAVTPNIENMLKIAGSASRREVNAHVSKGVCDEIYTDVSGGRIRVGEDGFNIRTDAYVLDAAHKSSEQQISVNLEPPSIQRVRRLKR